MTKKYIPIGFLILVLVLYLSKVTLADTQLAQENLILTGVYVEKNDTLWSLSQRYNNTDIEIRKYINQIMKENDLKNVILYPGQLIYFIQLKTI